MVLTLGIGIGASTAVYAVFNHALLRPIPGVAHSDRLVRVEASIDRPGLAGQTTAIGTPYTHLVAARAMPAFDGLAGFLEPPPTPVLLKHDADVELVDVQVVTRGYFEVLGVRAAAGRLFGPDEYETPGIRLAVISERLWRTRFNASTGVLGDTIQIAGRPFTVVGVTRKFRGLSRTGHDDVWIPWGEDALTSSRRTSAGTVIGRLAPGISLELATAQVSAAFDQAGPIRSGVTGATLRVVADLPGPSPRAVANLRTTLWIGVAGAVMLLGLACANAASLLLSRNVKRQRDLGVRAALGASRARLFRGLIYEIGLVSLSATVVGLVVADRIRALVAAFELRGVVPLADVALDWRVALSAIGVAALTVFLAGVLPSVVAARADPQTSLRNASRTASASGRTQQILVAIQLAVSVVLVACASLLAQSMTRLHAMDLGFDPDRLLVVSDSIRPSSVGRDRADAQRFHLELQRRLSEVPGIEAAAYSGGSPLSSATGSARLAASADAPWTDRVAVREVSSDYFRTMRIPILAGRDFTPGEAAGRTLSGQVIIDERLARQLFGPSPPVARRIWMEPGWLLPGARPSAEVIGVVGSIVTRDIRAGHQPIVYVPAGERTTAVHQVRTSMPNDQAIAAWRRIVRNMEPLLFVDRIVTPREQLDEIAVDSVILTRVSYAFAALAVLLALAGAYAVTARTAFERTREFGIRIALGASSIALAWNVLSRAVLTAALGLTAGAAIYVGASRFLESWLFGISARDPLTLAAACVLMTTVMLLAAWLPARRATQVDPLTTLRAE